MPSYRVKFIFSNARTLNYLTHDKIYFCARYILKIIYYLELTFMSSFFFVYFNQIMDDAFKIGILFAHVLNDYFKFYLISFLDILDAISSEINALDS